MGKRELCYEASATWKFITPRCGLRVKRRWWANERVDKQGEPVSVRVKEPVGNG